MSLLPEELLSWPIRNRKWPLTSIPRGRKQKQLGAHLFPLHPSWSFSFDVKFPGETGFYHCQLGLGNTRGFILTGQGTGISVGLCRGAWNLKDTGHPPHHQLHLKESIRPVAVLGSWELEIPRGSWFHLLGVALPSLLFAQEWSWAVEREQGPCKRPHVWE